MNLEPLYMIYTPSHHILKSYIIEHNKDHSWVTQTAEVQLNGGTHTPRNSNIVHLKILINITINLAKYGRQVLNILLEKILPPFQY